MVWTNGKIEILGGTFYKNNAESLGGVIHSADGSTTIVKGGEFQDNEANDGGVIYVGSESYLSVTGGTFLDNEASDSGGALYVSEDGNLNVRTKFAPAFRLLLLAVSWVQCIPYNLRTEYVFLGLYFEAVPSCLG